MLTSITDKKLYKHDCSDCIYLGSEKFFDFYFCKKPMDSDSVSLIIRFSDRPNDYYSMSSDIAEQGILSGDIQDSAFDTCYQLYKAYTSK